MAKSEKRIGAAAMAAKRHGVSCGVMRHLGGAKISPIMAAQWHRQLAACGGSGKNRAVRGVENALSGIFRGGGKISKQTHQYRVHRAWRAARGARAAPRGVMKSNSNVSASIMISA